MRGPEWAPFDELSKRLNALQGKYADEAMKIAHEVLGDGMVEPPMRFAVLAYLDTTLAVSFAMCHYDAEAHRKKTDAQTGESS